MDSIASNAAFEASIKVDEEQVSAVDANGTTHTFYVEHLPETHQQWTEK